MKTFLNKEEACNILDNMQKGNIPNIYDMAKIASIKVCLAGDLLGVDLWGKNVEDARILFLNCDLPKEKTPLDIENYKSYLKAYNDAFIQFQTKQLEKELE